MSCRVTIIVEEVKYFRDIRKTRHDWTKIFIFMMCVFEGRRVRVGFQSCFMMTWHHGFHDMCLRKGDGGIQPCFTIKWHHDFHDVCLGWCLLRYLHALPTEICVVVVVLTFVCQYVLLLTKSKTALCFLFKMVLLLCWFVCGGGGGLL